LDLLEFNESGAVNEGKIQTLIETLADELDELGMQSK